MNKAEILKLVHPLEGSKYPVISNPYNPDATMVKEKVFTKEELIAVLTELQQEIEDVVKEEELIDKKWAKGLHYSEKIIQHKINSLKEVKDGSN